MAATGLARLARVFGRLERAWPRQEITPGTGAVYAEALADLPIEAVEAGVEYVIRTATFFPVVAELRRAVVSQMVCLPTVEEAWRQAEALLQCFPTAPDTAWAPDFTPHPYVRQVLRELGGLWALVHSENAMADRAHFFRLYEDLERRKMDEAMMSPVAVMAELATETAAVEAWRSRMLEGAEREQQALLPAGPPAPPPPGWREALSGLIARTKAP